MLRNVLSLLHGISLKGFLNCYPIVTSKHLKLGVRPTINVVERRSVSCKAVSIRTGGPRGNIPKRPKQGQFEHPVSYHFGPDFWQTLDNASIIVKVTGTYEHSSVSERGAGSSTNAHAGYPRATAQRENVVNLFEWNIYLMSWLIHIPVLRLIT